jgi:hypothetical protein
MSLHLLKPNTKNMQPQGRTMDFWWRGVTVGSSVLTNVHHVHTACSYHHSVSLEPFPHAPKHLPPTLP